MTAVVGTLNRHRYRIGEIRVATLGEPEVQGEADTPDFDPVAKYRNARDTEGLQS